MRKSDISGCRKTARKAEAFYYNRYQSCLFSFFPDKPTSLWQVDSPMVRNQNWL